ncbi:GAF domain-containing protein [Chryseosolibacter indicus]|uniref:GAF domain-containing protein n=1 Tax=Chryseosolibacter indicus TaxID=2782351 RepID=A0ABS5VMN3_9BACT|nr:GAF domain-containing protein [Chryseosolibacter indicus]MBT1702708.1 GAF domain-containing protein [Chryseosolibacter indicus]
MFNFKYNRSAFFSVSVLSLIILVLVLASLFYYLVINQVEAGNNSMAVTAELTAQSVMEKVDRNFYERFGDVQAFAFNHLAISTAENDSVVAGTQEFLNTMTAYYVLYDLMMICNSSGKVLAVNTKDKNGHAIGSEHFLNLNMANEEWFKVCTSTEGPKGGAWYSDFTSNPQIGSIYGTKGYGMAFAAPIKNNNGNVVGVWFNYASWKEVTEGIREEAEQNLSKDHKNAFVVMTKSTGEIISTGNHELLGKMLSLNSEKALQNETVIPVSNYIYGLSKSKGAYTFSGKNWITATFIPKEKISWAVFFSKKNMFAVGICLLVLISVVIYIYKFFKKNIISRINELKTLQFQLSEGEIINVNEDSRRSDEFSDMKRSLSKLAKSLQFKSSFADEISKGNLTASLEHTNEKDALGNSLLNMQSQLLVAKQKDNERNWSAEGLAEIASILRSFNLTEELYNKIVKFVVTYLNANQGALFLITEKEEGSVLMLTSCYAYDKKKFIEKELNPDQGLIGQVIVEKQTLYLKEIPVDYVHITSGLGGASPKALLIVPLKVSEQVFGALELASFDEFKPYQIEFAEKLAESIAASLSSIQQTVKTKILLEQLQQQTEEMKSQEEEMRQNMEELSATQEEMIRKEKEYIAKINFLEKQTVKV